MRSVILNDRSVRLPEATDTPLQDFLRSDGGLTASKPGCGTGDCQICLVLVGSPFGSPVAEPYRAVPSCLLTTGSVAGRHVITPDALAGDGPTPVQRALVEHGGVQCGYCTPGFVVALTAALINGEPLLDAAAGTLCRCTGYAGIRRACAVLEDAHARRARTLGEAAELGLLPRAVADAVSTGSTGEAPGSTGVATGSTGVVGSTVLAGGTDWAVQHRHRAPTAAPLLRLHDDPALRAIAATPQTLRVGAAVTVAELQRSPALAADWPPLPGFLDLFGSPGIRALATVGGNLVNGSPVADLAVVLLALDADVELAGPHGVRTLPLASFHTGYKTNALAPGELVTAVLVPRNTDGRRRVHVEKVSRRRHDDIATINSAWVEADGTPDRFGDVRLSAGGVAPTPALLAATASALGGRPATPATVRAALAALAAEVAPIDDVRGSARYKRHVLEHVVVAHAVALHPALEWQECLS